MKVNFSDDLVNTRKIMSRFIVPMKGSPFAFRKDEAYEALKRSVAQFGVIEPITVLEPERYVRTDGNYQIISGRRRYEACKELGVIDIPSRLLRMPADDAMIALIDMNLCQRTDIPPSEKGAAYKLRLEAMKRQGYRTDLEEDATSAQPGQKSGVTSVEQLANESPDSKSQIKRFIRITALEPELQKMVDEKRIALTPAVELSYLPKEAQRDLITTIESEEATPSLSQAQQMRKLSEAGALDMDRIFSIMTQPKPNQKETIKVPVEYVRQFRPKDSISQLQKFIQDACAHYAKYLRNRDRGAR